MNVTLWGTRGSLAAPGPQTSRYGGNTACVEVRGSDGGLLVLDAGTGIRPLGATVGAETTRVDVMLTHLHMDHIQGLGFFGPLYTPDLEVHVWGPPSTTLHLYTPDLEVHVWGPPSTTLHLRERLARYLSPPLFPVRIRDLPCSLTLHDVPLGAFEIGEFMVTADLVCHPDPTVGYRISNGDSVITYLADHEPALGARNFPGQREWTSGSALAMGANLLIHDTQYTDKEYDSHVGWGHSSISHTLAFAEMAGVGRLVTFHHDPAHDDATLDAILDGARENPHSIEIIGGTEGASFDVG